MLTRSNSPVNSPVPLHPPYNSLGALIQHSNGRLLQVDDVPIVADNETKIFQVFKVTGTILVVDQYAEITEVTALTNCTDVYADVYDGTNTVDLTKTPGAVLTAAPVGTFFTKDEAASEIYTVLLADEVRTKEPGNKAAAPFYITAKNGADTYVRFHVTTNAVLNFKMSVWFWWIPINGGTIELV